MLPRLKAISLSHFLSASIELTMYEVACRANDVLGSFFPQRGVLYVSRKGQPVDVDSHDCHRVRA